MRTRQRAIEDLRRAIDCLPARSRRAMIEGIAANDIIVGAYSSRDGGICPMLAAHRNGGRTDLLAFARAWDRYTGVGRRARRATPRELRVLVSHLEASLLEEDGSPDLAAAIAEHRATLARRHPRPGDPDRTRELRGRTGWRWLRPFRRLDDYERALAEAHDAPAAEDRESVPA